MSRRCYGVFTASLLEVRRLRIKLPRMHLRVLLPLIALLWPLSAPAQERLHPTDVTELARSVHLPRADIVEHLAIIAPGFRLRPSRTPDIAEDPFLWTLNAEFGAATGPLPAGFVHCVRYGLATRDILASHTASDPQVFPIFTALRIETDDLTVWPDDAIALMRCSFAWDDARRLTPWAEAEAAGIIADDFAQVTRVDDALIRAQSGSHILPQYGETGFRLAGRDGPRESYYWVERLMVSRQISHQRVMLRVFLLGGGV